MDTTITHRPMRFAAVIVVVAASLLMAASVPAQARSDEVTVLEGERWAWPFAPPFSVSKPYDQPAHAYASGHRGIDIQPLGVGTVLAPDAGVVAFSGTVVDRAVVTIDHGGGLVSTLEPVITTLATGDLVERGGIVGDLAIGGHADVGTLHLGARLHGEYINPLLLLGGVPRAILLPCC